MKVDHFEDSTFREKYFKIQKNDSNTKSANSELLNNSMNSLDISVDSGLIQSDRTNLVNREVSKVNGT